MPEEQIKQFITRQPEPKQRDMQALNQRMLQLLPDCKLLH